MRMHSDFGGRGPYSAEAASKGKPFALQGECCSRAAVRRAFPVNAGT